MNDEIDLIALRAMMIEALDANYAPAWSLTPGLTMRRDVDGLAIVSAEGVDLAMIPHRHVPRMGRLAEVGDAMIADALGADPVTVRNFDDEAEAFLYGRPAPGTTDEHRAFVLDIENEAHARSAEDAATAPGWSALARWSRIELHMAQFVEAMAQGGQAAT